MIAFRHLPITSLLASALLLAACSKSATGRHLVLLFSEQDMSQLGAHSFEEMK